MIEVVDDEVVVVVAIVGMNLLNDDDEKYQIKKKLVKESLVSNIRFHWYGNVGHVV